MADSHGSYTHSVHVEVFLTISSPVIAINGQWPSPTIRGNVQDTIVVNVNNKLGNESLTIHWHGLFQTGNNANDGTPMVAQCPIIPGTSYTYTFKVRLYLDPPR
jgi:iron transport multicopper oxidase